MPVEANPFGDQPNASAWNDGILIQTPCKNLYYSRAMGDYFYKECPTGMIGSGKWVEVPQGKFLSEFSQEEADALALAYLEEQGQQLANLDGVCVLGDFTEVFTSMQTAVNWDWLLDKDSPTTPMCIKSDTGDVKFTVLPLMNLTFFNGLTGAPVGAGPAFKVPFDIHDTHGLMHINFAEVASSRDDLLGACFITSGAMSGNLIPFQTYGSFLLGDFGSTEIFGDENDDTVVPVTLGGILGIVETAESYNQAFTDGHFNGYIIAYKTTIQVYKWSDALDDYESIAEVPFSLKERTVYVGYGIRYDRGKWAAELYLNGAWQLSIYDDDIVSFTMMRYQRGVLSMDYWFGDVVIGSMSPFTNRVPPAVTVKSFEPTEIYVDYPTTDPLGNPVTKPDRMTLLEPEGTAVDVLDAVNGEPKLIQNVPVKDLGMEVSFTDGSVNGSVPFTGFGVRFDPNTWTEPKIGQQTRLFGCCPVFTYRWTKVWEAPFSYGMNRLYEGKLAGLDEIEFFNCSQTEFPNIIPTLSIFNDQPYNDFAYLGPSDLGCKPSGWDKNLTPEDEILGIMWPSMSHQTFPFNGQLYTKDYIASRWLYFLMIPQTSDITKGPTTFKYKMPWLRMFSGVRGLRTRTPLDAPVYEPCSCEYPTCGDKNYFRSTSFTMTVSNPGLTQGNTGKACDGLFDLANIPNAWEVQATGWHWDIKVEDILVDDYRKIKITLHAIAPELMGQVMNSSQIQQHGKDLVRIRIWRLDWDLPVWDSNALLTTQVANVPAPPPGFTTGMPPELTLEYTISPTLYEYDHTLPLFGDDTGNFYFEIMKPNLEV